MDGWQFWEVLSAKKDQRDKVVGDNMSAQTQVGTEALGDYLSEDVGSGRTQRLEHVGHGQSRPSQVKGDVSRGTTGSIGAVFQRYLCNPTKSDASETDAPKSVRTTTYVGS